jgi:hypothetical protein
MSEIVLLLSNTDRLQQVFDEDGQDLVAVEQYLT